MKAASVNDKLHAEKSELEEALSKGQSFITDMEAKVKKIEAEKKEVDRQVRTLRRKKKLCNLYVSVTRLIFLQAASLVVNKQVDYENGHTNIFGLLVVLELKVENSTILNFKVNEIFLIFFH